MPQLTIVVPAYNEASVLDDFHARLLAVVDGLAVDTHVLDVDDGSQDDTWERIVRHCTDARVAGLRLSRNFGKEAALTAGLDAVSEGAAVVIDADLQDPPELIPALIEPWQAGYDVVYATRSARAGESALKRFTDGELGVLVATDVAARGIDIDDIGAVIHYEPAGDAKDYLHRSGRTARAGRDGWAITLAEYNQHTQVRILQRALRLDLAPPIEVFSNNPKLRDLPQFLQEGLVASTLASLDDLANTLYNGTESALSVHATTTTAAEQPPKGTHEC